ncbi:MAG: hypothetical protein INQ03_13835 [Candidatus Heimdallarchaeota archaeon]|nr:hypothetical protein [Candidatus Heimdallarchaeota archaeon]
MDIVFLTDVITTFYELVILLLAISSYRKFKYNSLGYLIIAFTISLGQNILLLIRRTFFTDDFTISLILAFLELIGLIFSIYFFMVFFETFWADKVLSKSNIVLGAVGILISGATLILAWIYLYLGNEPFQGVASLELVNLDDHNLEIRTILEITGLLFFVGYLYTISLQIVILMKFIIQIRSTRNPELRDLLGKLAICFLVIFLGSILFISSVFWFLLASLGYFLLLYIYFTNGIFVIQKDSLRRLIIFQIGGLPLFTYHFNDYDEENTTDQDEDSYLFSGALIAISSLLEELTGSKEVLKQISLENSTLIISKTNDPEIFVVLFVERYTSFFADVLFRFSMDFIDRIGDYAIGSGFNEAQNKQIQELIEEYLGYKVN